MSSSLEASKKRKMEEVDEDTAAKLDLLGRAVKGGFLDKVKSVVESGVVDLATAQYESIPLLHHSMNNVDMMKYLISQGAQVDHVLVSNAVQRKLHDRVQLLMDAAAPEHATNAFSMALSTNDRDLIDLLLTDYSDDIDLNRAMFQVVSSHTYTHTGNISEKVLERLIDNGASVTATNTMGQTPLMAIASLRRSRSTGYIRVLVEKGAKVTNEAVFAAASHGALGVLKVLLELGGDETDVNATDGKGQTPLHVCRDSYTALFLVQAGADPLAVDHFGNAAMATVVSGQCDNEDLCGSLMLAQMTRELQRNRAEQKRLLLSLTAISE